jgi:hypothetical protein
MELVSPNKSEDASGMAEVDWLVLNSVKNVFIPSVLLFIWGFYGMGIATINLGCNFCFVEVFTLYGVFSDSCRPYSNWCLMFGKLYAHMMTDLYYIYFAN